MKNNLQIGDFIKLPKELMQSAKTEFEFGKVEDINGHIVDVYFVDERDINVNRLHANIKKDGLTFCLHHYTINF